MGPVRDPIERVPLSDEEEYQELLLGELRRRPPPVPAKPRGSRPGKDRPGKDGEDEGYVALAVGRRTEIPAAGRGSGWRALALVLAILTLCLTILLVLSVLAMLKHCVIGSASHTDGGIEGEMTGVEKSFRPLLVEVTCHSSERNTTHPYYFDGRRYVYVWTDLIFNHTSGHHDIDLGNHDLGGLSRAFLGDTFISPAPEVYIIGMEAWLRSARPLNYTFEGSPLAFGLRQTLTDRRPSELYRHAVLPLSRGDRLRVNLSESDPLTDTDCFASWDMFSLTSSMSDVIAFSVSRAAPWIVPDVIMFPDVHVNIRGVYSAVEKAFIAPKDGIYFFAFGSGLYERFKGHILLTRNDDVIAYVVRTTVSHDGYDMMSSAVIVDLIKGDKVSVRLKNGLLHSDAAFRQISFIGFLYDPIGEIRAWSLEMTPTRLASSSILPYDVTHVNHGDMFNKTSHAINITTSGYYHVHVTVRRPSRYTSVAIVWRPLVGEETKWPLNAVSAGGAGVYTSSTGTVWDLREGDALWVQVGTGRTRGQVHSRFIGFRIYDID